MLVFIHLVLLKHRGGYHSVVRGRSWASEYLALLDTALWVGVSPWLLSGASEIITEHQIPFWRDAEPGSK